MANDANRYIIGQMEKLENLTGTLSSPNTLNGILSNATLRGAKVELRIENTTLQYKYEDEDVWRDLIDLNTIDYEGLSNLPTLNGNLLTGELSELFMLPGDEISAQELNAILNE